LPVKKEEKDIKESENLRKSEEIIKEFIRTGENRFFEMLVSRYKDRVFRLVASILGPRLSFEAEDVTQEIFIKVYSQIPNFNFKSKFGTWLYRISYNMAIDYKRKRKNRLTYLSEDIVGKIKTKKYKDDPFKTAVNKEQHKALLVCMEELPNIYRSILYLFYWLGYSIKEIAEYYGINPETVKTYLHRGRQKLHRKMKQRGVIYEK